MFPEPSTPNHALIVATFGGVLYAVAVLSWAFSSGFQIATGDALGVLVAFSYIVSGMFLVAAIPLYLLGRLSLVLPVAVAAWSLGNTMSLRWYVPRPHDALASYLTIWPLFVGLIALAAIVEIGVRFGTDRMFGRFDLRALY